MSYFSLFSHSSIAELPKNYASHKDWLKIRYMKLVLNEITKSNPKTKILYDLFLEEKIGIKDNKLNKYDIVFHYVKLTKSLDIKEIINNYEEYGKYLQEQYDYRNLKDKKIILSMLNFYYVLILSSKIEEIYDDIIKIIKIIEIHDSEINQFAICVLISNTNIPKYFPDILHNIVNFRSIPL